MILVSLVLLLLEASLTEAVGVVRPPLEALEGKGGGFPRWDAWWDASIKGIDVLWRKDGGAGGMVRVAGVVLSTAGNGGGAATA